MEYQRRDSDRFTDHAEVSNLPAAGCHVTVSRLSQDCLEEHAAHASWIGFLIAGQAIAIMLLQQD